MQISRALSASALGLMALAAFGAVWAQQAPHCTWETASRISVDTLERSEERLKGQCVRVRGMLDYRSLSTTRSTGITSREITFIGAYFADDALRQSFLNHPRRVEALGAVGHCRDICAEADKANRMQSVNADPNDSEVLAGICMPIGHCHFYDDPYVTVQAVR